MYMVPWWKWAMVKNISFRKIKFGQLVIYSRLEFSEILTKLFPPIHSIIHSSIHLNGYIALYVISGAMRTVFMSNLSHLDILWKFMNRLYYQIMLPIVCLLFIWLRFLVFQKRFHKSTELWLKFLLFHNRFHKNYREIMRNNETE